MLVCLMNHWKRDCSEKVELLKAHGVELKVFTDFSNYKDTRNEDRYKGLKDNYLSIIRHKCEHNFKLILHDDMSITNGMFEKMEYILQRGFQNKITSFFHPTNKFYRAMAEQDKHVIKTFSNFWLPCHAFPKSMEADYIDFYDRNENNVKKYAEDAMLARYVGHKNIPIYVVLPTLSQHEGLDISLFNNPRKCGINVRESFNYNSDFDVTKINWTEEYNNAYFDRTKLLFKTNDNIEW